MDERLSMPFESHAQRSFLELMNEKTKAHLSDEELTKHMQAMLNHLKQKNEFLVYLSDLLFRLDRYILMMAPHQKERMGGKLLMEATEALQTLVIGGGEKKCRSNRKDKVDS